MPTRPQAFSCALHAFVGKLAERAYSARLEKASHCCCNFVSFIDVIRLTSSGLTWEVQEEELV